MPLHRPRPIALTFLLLSLVLSSPLLGQIKRLDGEWSMMLDVDYITGISPSMRGSVDQFKQELLVDYNSSRYPFGDANTSDGGYGGSVAYRFPGSEWSAMAGFHNVNFVTSDASGRVSLLVDIFSLLGEYAIGGSGNIWNTFLRAGGNTSAISGQLHYTLIPGLSSTERIVNIATAVRFGFEGEFGGRLNIPSLPVSAEIAVNYTNTNLFGKSYTAPASLPPNNLPERALNDGANPDKAGDSNRTIDFLAVRGGMRVWF